MKERRKRREEKQEKSGEGYRRKARAQWKKAENEKTLKGEKRLNRARRERQATRGQHYGRKDPGHKVEALVEYAAYRSP